MEPISQLQSAGSSAAPSAPLSERALLGVVIALTALVYLPVLRYGFVYDDQGIIVDNPTIRAWSYLPNYFKGQLWQHLFPNAPANYYRPLNLVMWRLNHALFGLQPMGWHAYTLLLHLLATALVFAIVRKVTQRPYVAFLSALLFGVHPVHHEVVAWVSSTTESLFTVLFLAGFLAYLKSREGHRLAWLLTSCVCYAGGLLSKETAIVLPGLVFAHSVIFGNRSSDPDEQPRWLVRAWRAVLLSVAYVPVCILYLAVRIHVLHGLSHSQSTFNSTSWIATLPSVLLFYLKQWLVPVNYAEFYDLPFRSGWDALHVGVPLAVALAIGAALWLFRRRIGSRELAFALIAIALPLLPAMNLRVFSEGELVHDRYLYLPSVGAAMIAGLALQFRASGRLVFGLPQRLVLIALAILLPLSYSTARAASYWADDNTLFDHAHRMAPANPTAFNNYAVQVALAGDPGTGILLLQEALKSHPNSFLVNYNLGRFYYQINMLPAAERYVLAAEKLDPASPDVALQRGLIYLKAGRSADAEAFFQRAIAIRPDQPTYHFALGVVHAQRANCQAARQEFAVALTLDPTLKKASEQSAKCGVTQTATPVTAAVERPQSMPVAPGQRLQVPLRAASEHK